MNKTTSSNVLYIEQTNKGLQCHSVLTSLQIKAQVQYSLVNTLEALLLSILKQGNKVQKYALRVKMGDTSGLKDHNVSRKINL